MIPNGGRGGSPADTVALVGGTVAVALDRLAGGEPPGAGGHGADGRLRGGHQPDQDRVRRHSHLDPQRRPARGHLRHTRRPRARPHHPRARCLGWEPLATKVGVDRRKPLLAMRETVVATRKLPAMERVTYHGEFVHLDDVEIDVVHGDRSPARRVPIYVGAAGMKMMELAGEIGDGVVLNYMVGPDYNNRAMAALAEGAARAGRSVGDIDRPQLVVCSVDEDRDLALDRDRELLIQYLGQQPHIMKASGVDPGLVEAIGKILTLAGRAGGDPQGDAPSPGRGSSDDLRGRSARGVRGKGR